MMNIFFPFMTNNEIFNHLLFLTSLNSDDDKLITLFASQGLTVNRSQIRRWRRKVEHSQARPVPNEILEALFRLLFDQKNKDRDFCKYPLSKSVKST